MVRITRALGAGLPTPPLHRPKVSMPRQTVGPNNGDLRSANRRGRETRAERGPRAERGANRRLACILIATLATVVITGCGAGVGAVTGTVTCGDKTLASGTVVIRGRDMIPYHGNIDEDGTYTVSKVPTGPATIVVVSMNPQVKVHPAAFDDRDMIKRRLVKAVPKPTPRSDPTKWFPIPEKYGDFSTTDLTLTVAGGVNPHDIHLEPE